MERKGSTLDAVRRKGRSRELMDGGKRKSWKNQTTERVIVREKAFPLLPWLQPATMEHGVYSFLAATHHVPGMNGRPSTPGPLAAASLLCSVRWKHTCQTQLQSSGLKRPWWRIRRIGLHWVWACLEANGIWNKEKSEGFISEAWEISSPFQHDGHYSPVLQKHPRSNCTGDLPSGDAVDHFYWLAGCNETLLINGCLAAGLRTGDSWWLTIRGGHC